MASTISSALAYALSCVGKPGLVLKDKQLEALKCLYVGKYVFLWVPTGYGKSICFQTIPPFLIDAKLVRTSAPQVLIIYKRVLLTNLLLILRMPLLRGWNRG